MTIPKGKLIAVGGAEQRSNRVSKGKLEVLRRILRETEGKNPVIEIITTASGIPNQIGKEYEDAFNYLGCTNSKHMAIRNRRDAEKKDFISRIKSCNGIMFSGGDQTKLSEVFLESEILEIMMQRYHTEEGFVIAGTSAGAMAQSEKMINGGTPVETLKKGRAKLKQGLGFINTAIIDSHFINRGRFGRLVVAVAEHPALMGIGISEDTGVIIKENRFLEVIGSNQVILVDGKDLKYNSAAFNTERTINLEYIIFHLFSKGTHFDIQERKIANEEQMVH
ncbi:MAG: cyanophycinase [Chitinophagales bacterium]